MENLTALTEAQYWTDNGAGIAVIPTKPRDKPPAIGKWKPYQSSIPSAHQLEQWFAGDNNMAIVTGYHGMTVIDFDNMTVFDDWLRYGDKNPLAALVQRLTYQVETGKGRHVYVRLPEATKSRPLVKPDGSRWGIDIKSRGGYVLAPPSIHPSGRQYRAINAGAMIFCVDALSEILPADMLMQIDYQPKGIRQPRPQPNGDIWDQVMNPVSMGPGTVDRIKAHYKLEDLLPTEQHTGDHYYLTCCPLHDDHNPSMWVDTDQQICGCYAGCTTLPLDLIDLYARVHDLSNSEAIRELARGL